MLRSLRDRTFIALFHSLGSFPERLPSFKSLLHCDCSRFVCRDVWSSSCSGQKSACCKGRWFPVLNKSFVHQKRRKEIRLASLCGCMRLTYPRSSFIALSKKQKNAVNKEGSYHFYRAFRIVSWIRQMTL